MHDDYNNKYNRVYNADNNGYNENYNTANNNIGKYNNYVTYNNNGQNNGVRDPGIPFEIYREHPEARLATKKDGRIPLVISSIICFVLLIIMGFTVFFTEQSRAETERIMNYNETVDGVVMKTWKSNISTSNSKKKYTSVQQKLIREALVRIRRLRFMLIRIIRRIQDCFTKMCCGCI